MGASFASNVNMAFERRLTVTKSKGTPRYVAEQLERIYSFMWPTEVSYIGAAQNASTLYPIPPCCAGTGSAHFNLFRALPYCTWVRRSDC